MVERVNLAYCQVSNYLSVEMEQQRVIVFQTILVLLDKHSFFGAVKSAVPNFEMFPT